MSSINSTNRTRPLETPRPTEKAAEKTPNTVKTTEAAPVAAKASDSFTAATAAPAAAAQKSLLFHPVGLDELAREFQMGVDAFKAGPLAKLEDMFGGDAVADSQFDGKMVGANGQTFPPGTALSDIPGVTPKNNPNPSETVIYTNGIETTLKGQGAEMQALADSTGAKVVGIHNATDGLVTDLAQCLTDKADIGTNKAVDTLADTVYSELKAGRDVHLVGYSQGGLDTARALFHVQQRLEAEDGMSPAQAEQTMSHIKAETFGAASFKYPDGPQYVHYINNADAVPTLTGLGGSVDPLEFAKDAGKGAVIHRYTDATPDLIANHMLASQYLTHRVPFDQARAGQFND